MAFSGASTKRVDRSILSPRLQFTRRQAKISRPTWLVSSLDDDDDGNHTIDDTIQPQPVIPTHLVLHFDINETILLGDDAGGDSRHESVQKMLAKSAFCRIPGEQKAWSDTQELEPTHWWDGQEIGGESSVPPLYTGWEWPEGACPYYRTAYKKHAKSFTNDGQHGNIYQHVVKACEASLSCYRTDNHDTTHSVSQTRETKHTGDAILPAFYETLCHLMESSNGSQPPPFTVGFRTFGSDLAGIADMVTAFAKGEHPKYPKVYFPALCLSEDHLFQGRWKVVNDKAVYQLWKFHDPSQLVASGDAEILELLSTKTAFGIRDDYQFWKANDWRPTAGKPIWVPDPTKEDDTYYAHHLLFDDNIHNLPDDGIACVRRESSPFVCDGVESNAHQFETVDGVDLGAYQGVHLVRVPTVEPVLNPMWYIEQIESARERLQSRLKSIHKKNK